MVDALERIFFRRRGVVLVVLALFTLLTGWQALGVRVDTAFEKHLPLGHEYIDTFLEYRDQLIGVNRVIVVLRAKHGDIWNPAFLRRLSEITDAVAFLPGIDRRTVTSLWTPNIRYIEITEEGMRSEDMIGADVTAGTLDQADVDRIRDRVLRSGLVGRLVSNDFTAAMVVAEAVGVDIDSQQQVGVIDLAHRLETQVRQPFQDDAYDVHIIGFVKMMGDIADAFWPGLPDFGWASVERALRSVLVFFFLAFALTALAVYAYARSWILTVLPLFCSLLSGVWQFGVMNVLGYGVDPLAILVPFLVFAIGVSHGIQQINLIAKRVSAGDDSTAAARSAFRGLLVPGSMALVTDLVAFATLVLIPIPMVEELGVTAAIGVAFKIVSNLVLLPVLASYFRFDAGFSHRFARSEALSTRVMKVVGLIAGRRMAVSTLGVFAVLFGVGSWQARDRYVGDIHAGATELRADSRYNRDAKLITERFSFGMDVLIVLAETPRDSCVDYDTLHYIDRFSHTMSGVPGVMSVMSISVVGRYINAAWNEGNLAWRDLPRNRYSLMQVTSSIPEALGVFNADCTLMPVSIFTADHRAETIREVVAAAEAFRRENPSDEVTLRLASGNVGVQAATNEVLERSERPMLAYAYAAILVIVFLTYRDWRAMICCCLPLTLGTVFGYWFMKELEIGLKVATLPVMVLAVGIGVDYAFYIYSRLQQHVRAGFDVTTSYRQALLETGNAVVFTGLTLALGVSTWAFSPLKFQADMGLLLAFMFLINMVMAATALPAVAVVLDLLVPRRRAPAAERQPTGGGR
jgi:predicted RND superfamily exporter protein